MNELFFGNTKHFSKANIMCKNTLMSFTNAD